MKRLMFKMFVLLGCIIATLSFAAEKMKSIVTTCDETKVELTCTKQNETGCLASKLRFQPKGMPEHFIKLPKEIKEASKAPTTWCCRPWAAPPTARRSLPTRLAWP